MTICGDGFTQPVGDGFLAGNLPAFSLAAGSHNAAHFRPADEPSPVAIENDLFPIFDLEHRRPQPDHHRHPERARDDGRVRCDASTSERNARGFKLGNISGA
jgi:hypothetical protein